MTQHRPGPPAAPGGHGGLPPPPVTPEFLCALVDYITDIIAVFDEHGRIAYVSPAVRQLLDRAPEEYVGRPWSEFVDADDLPQLQAAFEGTLSRPGPSPLVQTRMRHRDGRWIGVETVGRALGTSDGRRFLIVTTRDISERQQLEEQLRHAQKMEALGRLAGGIAHDFNNLLTVILGNVEMLLGEAPVGAPARDDLDQVRQAAERAAGLTRQLLAFSRKQMLSEQIFSVNGMIRGIETMMRRTLGEDIQLIVTPLAGDTARIRGDTGQLEQAIVNLVLNARDAMPRGGTLTIETSLTELDQETARGRPGARPGRYVRLAVRDTGTGIQPEVRPHLFEPFFTTKDAGKGTGLGLSTTYGIIRQSQGYMEVESEPGLGSTFTICLPRVDATEEAPPAVQTASTPHGEETVLIVEDEKGLLDLAQRILQRQGYRVLRARDASEALLIASRQEDPIHLLLTDIVLPGLSGVDLAQRLVAAHPALRVLYMSGYADQLATRLSQGTLRAGFLAKPFTPAELAGRVREAIDAPHGSPAMRAPSGGPETGERQ